MSNVENNNISSSEQSTQIEAVKADKIEIVYFHGNSRCVSCQIIEKYTKETLEQYFQEDIDKGKITFKSINGQSAENKEIVQKYKARVSSLFVNTINGEEENIEEEVKVWRLIGNEDQFKEYFRNKINNL